MEQKMKIIGLDIGGTKIHIGEVQDGTILRAIKFPTSAMAPKEQLLKDIARGIEEIISPEVEGIGIGVPGLVDEERGIVQHVQNIPSWRKVFLKDFLEERFRRPVYISNDANSFAAGEKMYGRGRDFANFVGITLGTGMGTGIIINHLMYPGAFSGAGEYGCIPYRDKILEDYCSGKFFQDLLGMSGKNAVELAEQGDTKALAAFEQFGAHVGNAIKMMLFSIAPEAVFLGGSISKCYEYFKEAMLESVREFPFELITDNLVIERSELADGPVLGAAALFEMHFKK